MTRAMFLLLVSAGTLAGCAELPVMEGTVSAAARARAAPELVPLDPILLESRAASPARAAQGALAARAATLSSARIPAPGTEGLDARGQQLRVRAATLRARPI